MKEKSLVSTIIGILFVSIAGSLLHFAYQWSGNNPLVGLFAATNESTWEHMKLLFFPMLLYWGLEALIIPETRARNGATGVGILAGTGLIPILFYTYTGILGYHIPILDISTFFISVIAGFYIRYRGIQSGKYEDHSLIILVMVLVLWAVFFLFTYSAPNLGIFQPPVMSNSQLNTSF